MAVGNLMAGASGIVRTCDSAGWQRVVSGMVVNSATPFPLAEKSPAFSPFPFNYSCLHVSGLSVAVVASQPDLLFSPVAVVA